VVVSNHYIEKALRRTPMFDRHQAVTPTLLL
jgi:hypothetical protein